MRICAWSSVVCSSDLLGLTYLFISHDSSVIGYVSDRVAVMYLGEVVEEGPTAAVLAAPRHPYTQALLSAVPRVERAAPGHQRIRLAGDLPSPIAPPAGCKFHTRCPYALEVCRRRQPQRRQVGRHHDARSQGLRVGKGGGRGG